mmetsp:Transcript_15593/g.60956  ORF Transcript_15593/g.60956 Transcript_15593/m.60956 type:complete len:244 (-) Transcript_15593:898-1629(-)
MDRCWPADSSGSLGSSPPTLRAARSSLARRSSSSRFCLSRSFCARSSSVGGRMTTSPLASSDCSLRSLAGEPSSHEGSASSSLLPFPLFSDVSSLPDFSLPDFSLLDFSLPDFSLEDESLEDLLLGDLPLDLSLEDLPCESVLLCMEDFSAPDDSFSASSARVGCSFLTGAGESLSTEESDSLGRVVFLEVRFLAHSCSVTEGRLVEELSRSLKESTESERGRSNAASGLGDSVWSGGSSFMR